MQLQQQLLLLGLFHPHFEVGNVVALQLAVQHFGLDLGRLLCEKRGLEQALVRKKGRFELTFVEIGVCLARLVLIVLVVVV